MWWWEEEVCTFWPQMVAGWNGDGTECDYKNLKDVYLGVSVWFIGVERRKEDFIFNSIRETIIYMIIIRKETY